MSDMDAKQARAEAKAATARAKAVRPWFKRKRIMIPLVVAVVVVFAALAGGGGDDGSDVAGSDSKDSPSDGRSEHYAVGDTATSSDVDITLHAVTDPFVPDNEFWTAPEGQRFVAVDMTLTNSGDDAAGFSTIMGLELFDSDNRAWNITITADNLPSLDGDLQPGETRRGTAVFEVPADAQLSHLIVKGSITATGSRFDLP